MGNTRGNHKTGRPSGRAGSGRRKKRIIARAVILLLVFIILAAAVFVTSRVMRARRNARLAEKTELENAIMKEESELNSKRELIRQADDLALSYDYDGAIELLHTHEDYNTDNELIDAIARYTAAKSNLQTVDPQAVSHLYFHSLIVDPKRAFSTNLGAANRNRNNAYTLTVDEFKKIITEMYDNGYVIVRMRDLVKETKNSDGTFSYTLNNEIKLPADKKAYVLSVDDWNYYHAYQGQGFADKAVLTGSGEVKCQYTDADGNTRTGDFDVVPVLDTFIKEHPDASYRGAKGIIALTGFNGCFGYRTDEVYRTGNGASDIQNRFLSENPDFDYNSEVAAATKIADTLKENGWEFAYHTWGHINVSESDEEALKDDLKKWRSNVEPIIGATDTMVFTKKNDIGDWHPYDAESNALYKLYRDSGFNYFCNVDASTPCWLQVGTGNVRQARIDCDGYQIYRVASGQAKVNVFEGMFNAKDILDQSRPMPVTP